jgi:hypothetical protein
VIEKNGLKQQWEEKLNGIRDLISPYHSDLTAAKIAIQ